MVPVTCDQPGTLATYGYARQVFPGFRDRPKRHPRLLHSYLGTMRSTQSPPSGARFYHCLTWQMTLMFE